MKPYNWHCPSACQAVALLLLTLNSSTGFCPLQLSFSHATTSTSTSQSTSLSAKRSNSEQDPAKQSALEGVLSRIERHYGRGSLQPLSSSLSLPTTPSGSLLLDSALGGGYPRGRIIEIYGPESSGKTTLALHAIAETQRSGGTAAFIDAEHALDAKYAQALGVQLDSLLVSQPDSGEMALDIVDQLVRSSAVDLVVVDSVAALVPRAELEGDMADMQVGLQARLMSKALRKITSSLSASQCTVLFLNQLRSKVGVIYGSPEVTSGGNALKFYASIRLDTRRKEVLPENRGIRAKIKVVKNKVAPPFRTVEVDIVFGEGMDVFGSLLDVALELGVVQRKGSWYSYSNSNFAQGRVSACGYLKEHVEMAQKMEKEVREIMSQGDGRKDLETLELDEERSEEEEQDLFSPIDITDKSSVLE